MIVYGRNPVREALRGRRRVGRVWATGRRAATEDWPHDIPLEVVGERELQALCGSRDHQGVCAEAAPYPYVEAASLLDPPDALVLCLDRVHDPQNLGAVCRVAECAGAAGVVIAERRSAGVTAAVCRASAGAVEHLAVGRVANIADFLVAAKPRGAWVYGAAPPDGAVPYEQPDYRGRVVLVLGSEGRGLGRRVSRACDELVALPVRGRVESLNVSTASAALVYGILHFRQALDRTP